MLAEWWNSSVGKRVLSGTIIISLFLLTALVGTPLVETFMLLILVALTLEWGHLTAIDDWRLQWGLGLGIFLSFMILYVGYVAFAFSLILLMAGVYLLAASITWRRTYFWTGLGTLYLGVPLLSFCWFFKWVYQGGFVLTWMIILVATTDICAYFVGRTLGGRKLAPRVSPNKTWSGFVGGLCGGIFFSLLYASFMGRFDWNLLPITILFSVISALGDLLESTLKRYHRVKDSGTLIPGHGGVLDRLDSYLLVLPCMLLLYYLAPQHALFSGS